MRVSGSHPTIPRNQKSFLLFHTSSYLASATPPPQLFPVCTNHFFKLRSTIWVFPFLTTVRLLYIRFNIRTNVSFKNTTILSTWLSTLILISKLPRFPIFNYQHIFNQQPIISARLVAYREMKVHPWVQSPHRSVMICFGSSNWLKTQGWAWSGQEPLTKDVGVARWRSVKQDFYCRWWVDGGMSARSRLWGWRPRSSWMPATSPWVLRWSLFCGQSLG